MLRSRTKSAFLHASIQLYGELRPNLIRDAKKILEIIPPDGRRREELVDGTTFASDAEQELAAYRKQHPGFDATVELREDIAAGLQVSRGKLLVARDGRFPASRVRALIHHEVGTHLVTYFNGRHQRLRQLASGLAGYERLQEGLAVLAEYLAGGLSAHRMRVLAGRVIAVDSLVKRASFVETFRLLVDEHGFSGRSAFLITLRVYRGGGFTKDAIYLDGLDGLLQYVAEGRPLEQLYIGKIGFSQVEAVAELERRGFFQPMRHRPSYLDEDGPKARLEALKKGKTGLDLAAELVQEANV